MEAKDDMGAFVNVQLEMFLRAGGFSMLFCRF